MAGLRPRDPGSGDPDGPAALCGCPCDEEGPGGRARGPEGGHVPPGRIAGLTRTARPLQCTEAPWRTGAPGQRTRARAPGERPCWVAGCRGPADGAEKPRGWILSARSRGAQRWPGADCGSRSPVSPLAHDDGVGLDAAAGVSGGALRRESREEKHPAPRPPPQAVWTSRRAGVLRRRQAGQRLLQGTRCPLRECRAGANEQDHIRVLFPETEVPVRRPAPCHSLRHSGV